VSETTDEATRRRYSRDLLLAGSMMLLALLAAGFLLTSASQTARDPVPAFALAGLDGGSVSSEELFGEPLVINVWASWCPPCREEAPTLSRLAAEFDGDGIRFLGIVSDDVAANARAFAAEADLDFLHAIDDGSFDRAYDVQLLPTTYIVDANGELVATHLGPISEARLRVLIGEARATVAIE
jgi:cytochrome c biogenesis protein CcmG, thiol:disulfide interchange protein DsbE